MCGWLRMPVVIDAASSAVAACTTAWRQANGTHRGGRRRVEPELMYQPIIGMDIADVGGDTKHVIRQAAELGFGAVQLPAGVGPLTPRNLSRSGRRHLERFVAGFGMRVSALVADAPGLNLTDTKTADQRVARSLEVLDLAVDLNVSLVTSSVGSLTHPDSGALAPAATEALKYIGEAADARGVHFALRHTRASGAEIAAVLDALACPAIGVCFDPAAMVMTAADPMGSIERYVEHVQLVHVRDAVMGSSDRAGQHVSMGDGDVAWLGLLAALDAASYGGVYIVRCQGSSAPLRDLDAARVALLSLLPGA